MTHGEIERLVSNIAENGARALASKTEAPAMLDYVAIFSKDQAEFDELLACVQKLGQEVDHGTQKTGHTFKLSEPMRTPIGELSLLKIRKPDPTRPQRGAPDFVVNNYEAFKKTYLPTSGDFTLMFHPHAEMVELKGNDVLVYIKEQHLKL
ncbi:MAG TPA: hypothetical protein VHB93_02335 [Candidatus Paceibacterota bacterium]|nr:hypothetical protein [Candidatus Paceibacterota bacterium]